MNKLIIYLLVLCVGSIEATTIREASFIGILNRDNTISIRPLQYGDPKVTGVGEIRTVHNDSNIKPPFASHEQVFIYFDRSGEIVGSYRAFIPNTHEATNIARSQLDKYNKPIAVRAQLQTVEIGMRGVDCVYLYDEDDNCLLRSICDRRGVWAKIASENFELKLKQISDTRDNSLNAHAQRFQKIIRKYKVIF